MIAHDPLHGSGRAGFPHPALTLGGDAQAVPRVGVDNAGRRQPAVDMPPHPFPANSRYNVSPTFGLRCADERVRFNRSNEKVLAYISECEAKELGAIWLRAFSLRLWL